MLLIQGLAYFRSTKIVAIAWNSNYGGTLTFSDVSTQINLLSGVNVSWTVPGTAETKYQALFSYIADSNIFVRLNGAAAIPGAGLVTTEQYNELRPDKRYVQGGDVLNFITPDVSQYVGVSLRQLQG